MNNSHTKYSYIGWSDIDRGEIDRLAEEFGTPFFLYDLDVFADQVQSVRTAFEEVPKIYFAVKSNPNLELLKGMHSMVDGLDISSGGELQQSLLADYNGDKLSFAGPAKSDDELSAAIDNDIGSISIESLRELRATLKLAKQMRKPANIVIRINPAKNLRAYGLRMGGRAAQFGIDEENVSTVVEIIHSNMNDLNFRGIHIYAGSQGFDHEKLVDGFHNTLEIASEIESKHGLHCSTINLGGGFGISHGGESQSLDVPAVANAILPALRSFVDAGERRVIFELGRYLVADSGLYVARVIGVKESRGKKFVISDGGLHHHLAAAGMFGVGLRSNYVVKNLSRPTAPEISCNIAGPSCNPTDLLGLDIRIPDPQEGDLIAVMKSGSYAFTASPILFLGRQTPAELVRQGGNVRLARRPRSMVEFN